MRFTAVVNISDSPEVIKKRDSREKAKALLLEAIKLLADGDDKLLHDAQNLLNEVGV